MIPKSSDFSKWLAFHQADIVLVTVIICIAIISFKIGQLSVLSSSKPPIVIRPPGVQVLQAGIGNVEAVPTRKPVDLRVVVSKNSKNKVYHYSWCSGASRIADKNKVIFNTEREAIAAGYTLAGNCK